MLRHALRPLVRLVMPLLAFLVAAPAFAQVDVEEVHFIVTVAKSSEVDDEITAEIRVIGENVTSGNSTIQFPGSATQTPLPDDGDDLALGISFANEAELAAEMPAGNYVLRIANGTREATLTYQRPNVPSPAISEPAPRQVLAPGPVEVLFTACPACAQSADSVEAALEGDAAATETLTEDDDSWIPPDGMGGDLALPENGEFVARITHTAVREVSGSFSGDDPAVFVNTFVQSDEVGFRTGFEPPTGAFCIVVNDPTPPAGCSTVSDPLLSIVDPSGMVVTSVDGHDLDYSFTVGEKGTVTGNAMADLDDDASQETAGAIKGKLKGKGGELKQKLAFRLLNDALAARLRVSVNDVLSIPLDSLARTQKASGRIGELSIKEEQPSNESPLPFAPQGWRVDFTVDAGVLQGGALELEQGRSFVLEGTSRFNLASNLSNLRLQTPERGIRIQLKKVLLDDESSPTAVVGGSLAYKILGQSGNATLP